MILEIDESKIINRRLVEGSYAQLENITSAVLPADIEDIGEVAFYGCTGLTDVVFPKRLKYIREQAFGDSAIEEAILPDTVELIAEKAFYSCENLRKLEIPNPNTYIEHDAFSCCYKLHEAYVACGYPDNIEQHEELQYTLFWCSCPDRHSVQIADRAISFIRDNEPLIMEWIIKFNNIPAMSGLARQNLLEGNINDYIIQSNFSGRSEITALLMTMTNQYDEGEFDL